MQFHGRILTVTLVNEEFDDPDALDRRNFTLINALRGLSISSISALSTTQVQLILRFDERDFD